jgi:YegS/Rv2252/BmrU family lipid kinase
VRRALLIANPAARRGGRLYERALAAFRAEGVQCDAVLTDYAGHGAEMVRQLAADYDAVFALGGDGTAIEIVSALAGTARPVGILPAGTGNLIARSLGIPLDVGRAVRLLLRSEPAFVDLGVLAGGRRFAFAAGVGVDASMVEETPAVLKRRLGVWAYVLTAARAVLRRDQFVVRAVVDGQALERRAVLVMVTNFGAVLNELIALGPGIKSDDGLLDLCVFSPSGLRDAVRVLWRLVRKDFRTDPCLLYRPGRRFRIETDPPRTAQADGEVLGPTPLEITVEPRGACLLVPRSG